MLGIEVFLPVQCQELSVRQKDDHGPATGVWEWELWPSLHDAATFTYSLALMPYSWPP